MLLLCIFLQFSLYSMPTYSAHNNDINNNNIAIHNLLNTRLIYAIINGNIAKAEQALREGANIRDSSLLHAALFGRSKKMIMLLLDHGMLLNTFHATIAVPDIYAMLAAIGIMQPTYQGPGNALSIALSQKNPSLVRLLLRYGAALPSMPYPKKSEDCIFVQESVQKLGTEGAFLSALITDDATALYELFRQPAPHALIPQHEHSNKLKRLKNLFKNPKRPFTLNTPNCYGKTPLMLAAVANKERIVLFLLHAHANAELKDNQGNTAYTLARHHGNTRIAELIASYILFYKRLIFAKYIAQKGQRGLTQDIAKRIAYYAITLD